MPTYLEARKIILDRIVPVGVEQVSILDAVGRVIAEEIKAPWGMPMFDNSAMDGYGVRTSDLGAEDTLEVTGFLAAGEMPVAAVTPGCAVKIMTGAPIPPGCDAVVPVEETFEREGRVTIKEPVKSRQHIRFKGEDVEAGDLVIEAGTLLRPPEISMLASFNRVMVPVYRKPRVALLATGDELVELGEPPTAGRIVNSNTLSLAAALRETGAEPVLLGIAKDNLASHLEKIRDGLKADVLITSAGVSAGDKDMVRQVLEELGVELCFWRVEIKPGGPTAFGMYQGKPVFSLPGNPVSSIITFEELVRPALLRMMGRRRVIKPFIKATLQEAVRKKPGKVNFLRVGLELRDGRYFVKPSGDQHTGILRTMLRADAIAVLPSERTEFAPGEELEVHLLGTDAVMLEG